jgi:hypothetical protein
MLLQHPDALAVKFIDVRPSVTVLDPVAVEHVLRTDWRSFSKPTPGLNPLCRKASQSFDKINK